MNSVVPKKQTSLAVPESETTTLLGIIERAARDPSIDIAKMERLFALRKEIAMEGAQMAFNQAMTAAQQEMRRVSADASNPQTHSRYASYAALDRALRPIYTKHGFAISFDEDTSDKEGYIRVVAHVSHTGGYTRPYRADMPADGKGAKGGDVMTKTHAAGAAKSYGMRYLLKGIFNVAVGEDDNDGNQPVEKPAAPEGYETWKADMTAKADEGVEALQKAWKDSKGFRGYAATIDAAWWVSTKRKAVEADKRLKVVDGNKSSEAP